ncbi:DNA repair protein RecN [Anaerosalibacter massiliensis]|uniref:DNA repair protein RecN n=1 Tax=Anaerosalibacter massiliensis TaxID=1347392 RepID=A0A9X2MFG9_9FIRM|nr:DNA repair protein RecN [Anaerosalibacter massiliensis]MCR2042611.1 DNA repair protein RecN [Anaerosalibacter massiliensis]
MIVELNIENFAIVEKLHINFNKGLNVLTGETGAGKSIIVEAISLILGGRANKDLIRTGYDKAILEGLFFLEDSKKIEKILKKYGIENDNNNYMLITRELHSTGRSVSRINGRTVTVNMLDNITKHLIDIHGQHEHQSLLNTESHIDIIDSFGDKSFNKLKEKVASDYMKVLNLRKKLKELSLEEMERDREIDILKYQIEEIDSAKLSQDEEKDILNEYNKLNNAKDIVSSLGQSINILQSKEYDSFSTIDSLNEVISLIEKIKENDIQLDKSYEELLNINYELQDITRNLNTYMDNLALDNKRLEFLEDRINTINKLKKKYGNTINEIFIYRDKMYSKLQLFLNMEEEIQEIKDDIKKIEDILKINCGVLTDKRKLISKKLENNIFRELQELNMKDIVFKVDFKEYDYFTVSGVDKVEFLISTNPGEKLKPLSKIVSGGEMSRIMLAFKSILAEYDYIPCLIFDEIDTGISGRTAQVVGEKINKISKNHQVICISHLPQIAALADMHFAISKKSTNNKTSVKVKKLDYEERINELARLLGGVNLTNTTKLHAKEMLELTKKIKK